MLQFILIYKTTHKKHSTFLFYCCVLPWKNAKRTKILYQHSTTIKYKASANIGFRRREQRAGNGDSISHLISVASAEFNESVLSFLLFLPFLTGGSLKIVYAYMNVYLYVYICFQKNEITATFFSLKGKPFWMKFFELSIGLWFECEWAHNELFPHKTV